ncbi:MAG: hypothetical protein IIC85_01825 [Chloroflexi bacterium]|nr:hypothetical protein [Chloroflexota bacterium]
MSKQVYIDRSYTFTGVPGRYLGQELILTANSDKNSANPDFLSFSLSIDATVNVLYDDRVTTLPGWLDDGTWTLTGDIIGTSDADRRVYQKDFLAGQVQLGGNAMAPMSGANSNYSVIVAAPETTITSSPSSITNDHGATFTFTSGNAGSTFECQLDGSGFSSCVSPQSYAALSDGTHTFEVRAIDPSANPDPTPAGYTWAITSTPLPTSTPTPTPLPTSTPLPTATLTPTPLPTSTPTPTPTPLPTSTPLPTPTSTPPPGSTSTPTPIPSPVVSVTSAQGSVGQTVPVDIVLQTVSNGISGFVIELSVQNAVIAQIQSVTLPGYGLVVVTGTPGPTALVIVADANEILQGQITSAVIATVNINLLTAGTSPLTITLSQLDSDSPTEDLLPVTLVVSGSVTAN